MTKSRTTSLRSGNKLFEDSRVGSTQKGERETFSSAHYVKLPARLVHDKVKTYYTHVSNAISKFELCNVSFSERMHY